MKVRVESDWLRNAFDITIYRQVGDQGLIEVLQLAGEPAGTTPVWVAIPRAERPPITLRLHEDALEGLMAAAGDHLPPSAATERHLADAVAVRDRVLGLVEHLASPPARLIGPRGAA